MTILMVVMLGEPQPTVTWRRADGQPINLLHRGGQAESHGPVLQLGKLSPRDGGDYLCVARNNHPPPIMKTIRINVMCRTTL